MLVHLFTDYWFYTADTNDNSEFLEPIGSSSSQPQQGRRRALQDAFPSCREESGKWAARLDGVGANHVLTANAAAFLSWGVSTAVRNGVCEELAL